MFNLPQLWFDGEGEALEELIAVAIKRHLSRLHQYASSLHLYKSLFHHTMVAKKEQKNRKMNLTNNKKTQIREHT